MVKVYVEGGGTGSALRAKCRQGFAQFFEKTPLNNIRRPRVVACGGRQEAYEDFCTAIEKGECALLLVDSEVPIATQSQPSGDPFRPWDHLLATTGWRCPEGSSDKDCHLMVQVMESWFLADWQATAGYFGREFHGMAPPTAQIEELTKDQVIGALPNGTSHGARRYNKGKDSFTLLGQVDAMKVLARSPWAKRLVDEIDSRG